MESLAAVTMDVHAHMAKTEVIGLLGGHYAPGEGRLTIMAALPCESLSTGMQCEMDPGKLYLKPLVNTCYRY